MKFLDIKGLTPGDLKKKKKELLEEIFHSRMKNSLGQLGNPLTIRYMRKDIARIETALKQKALGK